MPWMIIASLLSAALLIKPQPLGQTVAPPVKESRDRFYGITLVAPGYIWLVGNDGKIIISTDAGLTWSAQNSHTEQHLQDITAWDANRAIAVGNDGVLLVTADGGRGWQQIKVPRSSIFNKLLRVITLSDERAIAVGAMGAILMSSDRGNSWHRVREEEDVAWNGVVANGDTIWVVGEFGRLLKSIDGGMEWRAVESPVKESLTSIAFNDPLNGVVVGLDGTVLVTNDGGQVWVSKQRITKEHLFDVVYDEDKWIAVGSKNIVLTTDDNGLLEAKRLTDRNLAWHTAIKPYGEKLYITGASVGQLDDGQWTEF